MRREDLRNQGLTDAQIEFVMQQNGQDIEAARQSNGDAQAERARADALHQQLTALNNDLTEARNNAANAADLRRQLDAAQARIKASSKANAIRDALVKHKPRDAAMLMRLLDDEKINHAEDGTLTGLDEQVEALKNSSSYLFDGMADDKGGSAGAGNGGGAFDMNAFLRGAK